MALVNFVNGIGSAIDNRYLPNISTPTSISTFGDPLSQITSATQYISDLYHSSGDTTAERIDDATTAKVARESAGRGQYYNGKFVFANGSYAKDGTVYARDGTPITYIGDTDPAVWWRSTNGTGNPDTAIVGASGSADSNSAGSYLSSQNDWDYISADLAQAYGMEKEIAYSEALENTAYQRAVKDMQAAGLNPASLFGSGSSAGSFSVSPSSSDSADDDDDDSLSPLVSAILSLSGEVIGAVLGNSNLGKSLGSSAGKLFESYAAYKN